MKLEIAYTLEVAYRHDKETGEYVGWCPSLRLYSQGETEEEVGEALKSSILTYLRHCYSRRILDQILNERGFAPSNDTESTDSEKKCDSIEIKVRHDLADEFSERRQISVPMSLVQQTHSGLGSAEWPA